MKEGVRRNDRLAVRRRAYDWQARSLVRVRLPEFPALRESHREPDLVRVTAAVGFAKGPHAGQWNHWFWA